MSFWDFLPTVLQVGATLYGTNQASKANNQAANTMADAQKAGTDAQLKGLEMAKEELAVNRNAASPGLLATQELIARGAALNPQQEQAVADTRAEALNALKGSSLRGSARTTSAVVADADKRSRDNFMAQNQSRADSAATNLSSQYFGAGNSMANNSTAAGGVVSQGLVNTGNINGANDIGQGVLAGRAIGDIGATVADSIKSNLQEERSRNYAQIKPVNNEIIWNDGGA